MTAKNWAQIIGLTCAAFIFNTSEFMPIGLLTDIAQDFAITEAHAGTLISVYAWVVMLLSLPLMILVSKLELRKLMLWIILLFGICQILSSLSEGYAMLMLSRIGVACTHAIFWSIVSPLAVHLAPEGKRQTALGMIVTGISLAIIAGLPLGRVIGLHLSWRVTFLCIGAAALLAFVLFLLLFPAVPNNRRATLRSVPRLLRSPVMVALYVLGILTAVVLGYAMRKTVFKGEAVPFVMELPNYRMPGAKNVLFLLWEKAKDFLERAFTVIFVATIAIWFLQSFDFQFNPVENSQESMLAVVAGGLAPLFEPLGFGDWRVATALISGFMAKESVVSTISVLFGSVDTLLAAITPLSALALLVFCLLYTPCVASIATIRRELGGKWAVGVVLMQCAVAWIVALIVRVLAAPFF